MPLGFTSTRSWTATVALGAVSLLPFGTTGGCTLDDGSLSQTVAVDVDASACAIRIINASGDLVLEARSANQERPTLVEVSEENIANSTASDAVFAWSAVVDEGVDAPAPSVHFDPKGTLVVDAGCTDLVEANIGCVATLQAWAPEHCHLEVLLGTSTSTTIVGFAGDLDLTADATDVVDIEHDGTATLSIDDMSRALRLCGEGEFELDVNGDVEWCEGVVEER